ncbi:MAG: class I SAM-dependent methyltransferase [Anaerolineae bacterium]
MWDRKYQEEGCYGGEEPEEVLVEYLPYLSGGRALDLGCGEGWNALFLAEHGFTVEGIDISPAGVEKCLRLARQGNLSVEATVADLRDYPIPPGEYALILAVATLHFLTREELEEAARRIRDGLGPGGAVFITVFTTDDPGYQRAQEAGLKILEENTFFSPGLNGPIHYFAPDELRDLFADFEILHYAEERFLDVTHGSPHYHAGATLLARKPLSTE